MKKKILIVEDQPVVALDYQWFFENKGYQAFISFTGKSAMDQIKSYRPDLALLDIRLKDDISGIEIAKILKQSGIPFIFISAFSEPSNYKKALELNPSFIFHKPVSINTVNKVVEKILSNNI